MGTGGLSDDLVRAAIHGDQDAFRAVYQELAPSVCGYLRARGAADPEAVTSDVFLAVLPRLARLHGGANGLQRLVFTIAHARMVDELRERTRHPAAVAYTVAEDARTVASAEQDAVDRLATSGVLATLDGLPDDQREALVLRIVADLSIEQTAAVMGRSAGAVKQLQRRGLIAVRSALESGHPALDPARRALESARPVDGSVPR